MDLIRPVSPCGIGIALHRKCVVQYLVFHLKGCYCKRLRKHIGAAQDVVVVLLFIFLYILFWGGFNYDEN